jgi:signal peptidase I
VTGPGHGLEWLVKRLAAGPGEPAPDDDRVVPADRMVLLGDNPAHSTDSRQVGYFAASDLLGVVVRRMRT